MDSKQTGAEARLEKIQAITDSTLVHAEVEVLLNELLDRVREILDVDTAVALLLDRSARQLVARAAQGIEEEAIQRVHVPLGSGFAGRIAAEQHPVIIENTDTAELFNPLLVQRGLRSLLGVPMIASGILVGVIHVGTLTRRRFTGEDVELLQVAADRAAMAVHTLSAREERAAAGALQQSLLPAAVPAVAGAEIAVRYAPGAASVGGDWFDVFTLPTKEVCLVMGDVAGHGLDAAVIMGRLRSVVRGYALQSRDPAEVLERLDQHCQHFEPEVTATVLFAVCDPSLDQAGISSAGHLPPVLVAPGQPAVFLDVDPDPLIGTDRIVSRRTTTVDIPKGSMLCMYTDGLVERKDRPIEDQLTILRESLYLGPPEAVCTTVMATLLGRHPAEDDIAMLVLRHNFNRWDDHKASRPADLPQPATRPGD